MPVNVHSTKSIAEIKVLDIFSLLPDRDLELFRPGTSDSFTKFPKLPAELRDEIWLLALFHKRIISFGTLFLEAIKAPPPIILQVSHESRQVALKNLKMIHFPSSAKNIYFHPPTDTIVLPSYFHILRRGLDTASYHDVRNKKSLMFKTIAWLSFEPDTLRRSIPRQALMQFWGLKELILMGGQCAGRGAALKEKLEIEYKCAKECNPAMNIPKIIFVDRIRAELLTGAQGLGGVQSQG